MNDYMTYVWIAYGVAFAIIAPVMVASFLKNRALKKRIATLEKDGSNDP